MKSDRGGGGVGRVGLGWVGVGSNNNTIIVSAAAWKSVFVMYGALRVHSTSFSLTPLSG